MRTMLDKKCKIKRRSSSRVPGPYNRPISNLEIIAVDVVCAVAQIKTRVQRAKNSWETIITLKFFTKDIVLKEEDTICEIVNSNGVPFDDGPYIARNVVPIGLKRIHHYECELERAE